MPAEIDRNRARIEDSRQLAAALTPVDCIYIQIVYMTNQTFSGNLPSIAGIHAATPFGMEYARQQVLRHSSRGTPFFRGEPVGMPRIPDSITKTTFYLYPNRKAAEKGHGFGGTGCIIGIESEAQPTTYFLYAVTNWHVAVKGGNSVIRINTSDGKTDIFEHDPSDWQFIPGGPDICALPLHARHPFHDFRFILPDRFATPELIKELSIDAGEDVLMVGRFVDHDGGEINMPALRFGNISVMPTKMRQPTGYVGDAYCIDLHSRSGYSGSPVFVYRTIGQDLTVSGINLNQPGFILCLGIHFGQFSENWDIEDSCETEEEMASLAGKRIVGASGMTTVIPIWEVMRLLNSGDLMINRKRSDAHLAASKPATPRPESAAPIPETVGLNPDEVLKRMLDTPPNPYTVGSKVTDK